MIDPRDLNEKKNNDQNGKNIMYFDVLESSIQNHEWMNEWKQVTICGFICRICYVLKLINIHVHKILHIFS